MMPPLSQSTLRRLQQQSTPLLAVVCVTWLVLLGLVAIVTHQVLVADEAGYLLPMLHGWSAANYQRWTMVGQYPSYLYFWLYSLLPSADLRTNAKLLNAALVAAAALPAYALARRLLTAPLAALFTAIVVLSPINSFVFVVTPEVPYFLGFWLVVLFVIVALRTSPQLASLGGGALMGALSLVKPHAIALTMGTAVFFLLRDRLRGLTPAVMLLIAYYVVRVALGYPLTGQWLWSPSGSAYGGVLVANRIDLSAALFNLAGHSCAIVTLIAIPLALTVVTAVRHIFDRPAPAASPTGTTRDLALLACCLLAAMIAMTVYFSQSVYQLSPVGEDIARLHGRYYLFALPLFVLVALALWQQGTDLPQLSRGAVVILCAAALVAALIVIRVYRVGPIDFPDLALANWRFALPALLAVPLGIALFARNANTSHLIVAMTLWCSLIGVVTSAALVAYTGLVRAHDLSNPVDAAFLDRSDMTGVQRLIGRPDGIVVGGVASASDLFRAMVYLRCLCEGRIVADGTELKDSDLPRDAHWAVILAGTRYLGSGHVTQLGSLIVMARP
jgi:phosphoglycerol transferase